MVKNEFSAASSVFGGLRSFWWFRKWFRSGEHQDVTKIFIEPPIHSNENNSDVDSGDEEDPSIDNLSGNQLLAPVSLVVKDVKKGEIHVEQKKDQQEKDPGGSNCSDTGSKKKSFEKSWKWKEAGQEEGEESKRNSCEPMAT